MKIMEIKCINVNIVNENLYIVHLKYIKKVAPMIIHVKKQVKNKDFLKLNLNKKLQKLNKFLNLKVKKKKILLNNL